MMLITFSYIDNIHLFGLTAVLTLSDHLLKTLFAVVSEKSSSMATIVISQYQVVAVCLKQVFIIDPDKSFCLTARLCTMESVTCMDTGMKKKDLKKVAAGL